MIGLCVVCVCARVCMGWATGRGGAGGFGMRQCSVLSLLVLTLHAACARPVLLCDRLYAHSQGLPLRKSKSCPKL